MFKAYMIGLPSKISKYVNLGMWYLLALIALLPVLLMLIARLRKGSRNYRPRFGLGTRILSILLAFLFIITPSILQQVVQASSQYSQVSTTDWATHTYIEYTYDDNGSCTSKTTKNSSNTEVESVAYEYNLQNRLFKVTTDPISGSTVHVTEYTYNNAGNRVRSYSYDMPRGGGPYSNEVTTSYLIDAYNHTGYAQVLEEYDGTNSITYTIGDDIVSQSRYNGSTATVRHYLYDGQGSTRQLTDNSGALATDQSFSYDGYGVMVGYSGTPQTNLLYTGEYYDSNLKQYNLRARYYNPSNGRFNRMDPYSGNNQDPQSLHKYLYCHANPVNGIDPSGRLFSSPYHGRRVHYEIGMHFLRTAPGTQRFYDRRINTILGIKVPWWGWNRPDLIDKTTAEVWEIKPFGAYVAGAAQLGWYLLLLNSNDPAGRTWKPGIVSYSPPPMVKIDAWSIAIVSPPIGGVIQYEVLDLRPAIGLVIAYTLSQIQLDIGMFTVRNALCPVGI